MIEGFLETSIIALGTKFVSVFQANHLTVLLDSVTKWPTVPYFVLFLWHMRYKNAIF